MMLPESDKGGGIFGVVLHQIHPGWYGFQELQIPAQTSLTSPPQAIFLVFMFKQWNFLMIFVEEMKFPLQIPYDFP